MQVMADKKSASRFVLGKLIEYIKTWGLPIEQCCQALSQESHQMNCLQFLEQHLSASKLARPT